MNHLSFDKTCYPCLMVYILPVVYTFLISIKHSSFRFPHLKICFFCYMNMLWIYFIFQNIVVDKWANKFKFHTSSYLCIHFFNLFTVHVQFSFLFDWVYLLFFKNTTYKSQSSKNVFLPPCLYGLATEYTTFYLN